MTNRPLSIGIFDLSDVTKYQHVELCCRCLHCVNDVEFSSGESSHVLQN